MSERRDWIRIDLAAADMTRAQAWSRGRQERRVAHRAAANRFSYERALEGNRIGVLGELAVAKYEAIPITEDDWFDDKRRGYDVAGWSVRTRPMEHYGLGLHRGDSGKFLLALSHKAPVIWLVGSITADEGFRCGQLRHDGAYRDESAWWLVEQAYLHPLPNQNGYTGGLAKPVNELRRCRILELGRDGCGCITCQRELAASG